MHIGLPLRLLTLSALVWSSEGIAQEATALESESAAGTPESPEDRLSAAIESYQLGNRTDAIATLADLAADPANNGTTIKLHAMIYLGEIHYLQGELLDARRWFERVVHASPGYVLDPFRHHPDASAYFNQVKHSLNLPVEPNIAQAERLPKAAWAPLGIYHLQHDRRGRGLIYGGSQALSGITSIVLASILYGQHDASLGGVPYPEGDTAELERLQRLQTANLLAFLGFYGSWSISVVDAYRHHWQAGQGGQGSLHGAPSDVMVTLQISW